MKPLRRELEERPGPVEASNVSEMASGVVSWDIVHLSHCSSHAGASAVPCFPASRETAILKPAAGLVTWILRRPTRRECGKCESVWNVRKRSKLRLMEMIFTPFCLRLMGLHARAQATAARFQGTRWTSQKATNLCTRLCGEPMT